MKLEKNELRLIEKDDKKKDKTVGDNDADDEEEVI